MSKLGCAALAILVLPGLLLHLLHLLHLLRMVRPLHALLFRLVERFGMQVIAALTFGLVFLDREAASVSIGVLTNAGHLPGDLHAGLVSLDREAIAPHLAGHDG